MNLRIWLQSAGVAVLVLFVFYLQIIDTPGEVRMHAAGSPASFVLSLVVNLILVSLLCMLLKSWLHGTSIWRWLSLILPAFIFASLVEVIHIARGGTPSTKLFLFPLAALLAVTLLLRWRWKRGEKLLLQLSGGVLIGLGFFCIFVVIQLLRFSLWRPLPNYTTRSIPSTQARANTARTVWILFDGLSYLQVFGDRFSGLQLPNFDALRKSSTLFTNTEPIVNFTEDAVPSLFLGQAVERVDYTSRNKLRVGASSGPLTPFDAGQTLFATAHRAGLTTGVVGWWNPYCGMLAPYVDQCYWTNDFLGPSGLTTGGKFLQNLIQPWALYGAILGHPLDMLSRPRRVNAYIDLWMADPGQSKDNRILIYRRLMEHAIQILKPSGPDFVFLHLPIPHPSGLYDRKTQKLDITEEHSYIDNLALADKTLGEILAILQKTTQWDNTNVIVCGDHSWRTYLWKANSVWTPEDEAASHGGVFDPRPMLMIHLAGQTEPESVDQPFPLLKLHDILGSLAKGQRPDLSSMRQETVADTSTNP